MEQTAIKIAENICHSSKKEIVHYDSSMNYQFESCQCVFVPNKIDHVNLMNCTNCSYRINDVKHSLVLCNCHDIVIEFSTRQCRLSNCERIVLLGYCSTAITIENCRELFARVTQPMTHKLTPLVDLSNPFATDTGVNMITYDEASHIVSLLQS